MSTARTLCLAAILFSGLAYAQSDEPMLDDKPLSQWVQHLRSKNRGEQVRAARALAAAPTNLHVRIIPMVLPVLKSERENDKFVAAQVLGTYGPAARVAVPDLLPMLEGMQYERNRAAAAKALGQILKDAASDKEVDAVTAALIKGFGDIDIGVRLESVSACGMIGPAAKACIPYLKDKLVEGLTGDCNSQADGLKVRSAAAWTCGRMGPLASEHIDLLITRMHAEGGGCPAIVEGIGRIGAVHDNVVQNIMDAIETPGGIGGAMQAYVALEQFGPKAAPAVPLLCRLLKNRSLKPELTIQCVKTLKAIGPAATEAVSVLKEYQATKDVGAFGNYAYTLRYITPEQLVELKKCCGEAIAAITGKNGEAESK